jgi:hypothetical protein
MLCGIVTRARKPVRAALESARTSATSETSFEDLPRDIKRQILGEANLPDPVDVARVRAVSRSMRDAVDDTGREIDELCDSLTAAHRGYLSTLQNQLRRGCPNAAFVCALAACGGHLEVLQWARENDCPWDEDTCANAAFGGHLEVLQWARENGCPWDKWTCAGAALCGHLEVLKWARTNGCPWDEWTCAGAALGGHLEVLKWARANGCPDEHDS